MIWLRIKGCCRNPADIPFKQLPGDDLTDISLDDVLSLADEVVREAQKSGADAADALVYESISLAASHRLGKLEDVERSESRDLGIRVFVGQKQATISSNDFKKESLRPLIERVISMAKAAPEDPYAGLADKSLLATRQADLDLLDRSEPPTSEALADKAARVEEAALAVDGVTNSEGASASWGSATFALATSEGFCKGYTTSRHGMGCSVIAGSGTAMERDYEFSSARHADDLKSPEEVGKIAGERTVKRLNPKKAESQSVPIVYDPRVSRGLIGHFAGAINGRSIARGVSFLKDKLDKQVFDSAIRIVDEPHRPRGLGSMPFDGEGVACDTINLIENGKLTCWLLDTASAKQLSLTTNGRAARGTGGPPSPSTTNLYMAAGSLSPQELMKDIKQGFYVTELIGMGVNGVTGDYSRGATGFWIENGELTHPVNEVTVAGNLVDMFRALTPANDLVFEYGANAPTIRIDGMTVAGT